MEFKSACIKIYQTIAILLVATIFSVVFYGCSDGSGNGENANIVTKYTYNLTQYDNYYRVNVFNCVESGTNSYNVKSAEIHLFSKTNSKYTGKTGAVLCDMVRTKAVAASSSENRTQTSATSSTSTNSSTGVTTTFNIPSGMEYTVYYYF